MSEQIDFTTPVPQPTKTNAKLVEFYMNWELQRVHVTVRDNTGVAVDYEETGLAALNIMKNLNTANMSPPNKTLTRRALEYIASKKAELAGTVSGTPE